MFERYIMEINEISKRTVKYDYPGYLKMIREKVENEHMYGHEAKFQFVKLNYQRMKRAEKQFVLNEGIREISDRLPRMNWMVITEPWCGDAAQSIPVIAKLAEVLPVNLELILRDENPSVMDRYLTNGNRSIPILVISEGETELATWGSRPQKLMRAIAEFKVQYQDADKEELLKYIQIWYARDKGQSVQNDILKILSRLT